MSNDQGPFAVGWVAVVLCSVVIGLLAVILGEQGQHVVMLKAQLASVQPTAVSGAIFIEPTDQPLDRVTWTDPVTNKVHLLACGEPIADNLTGEMQLVSQYRVGKTIAKINLVIP